MDRTVLEPPSQPSHTSNSIPAIEGVPDLGIPPSSQQEMLEAATSSAVDAGALQGASGGEGGIQYNIHGQQNSLQLQQIKNYEL